MVVALLVKNFGKFGTVALALAPSSVDKEAVEKQQEMTGNNSETDGGSDTEDESQKKDSKPSDGFSLPTSAGVVWYEKTQEIAKKLFQDKKHKVVAVEKLDGKQSKAIPGNATTIIIQCGQLGSLLVLSKMDELSIGYSGCRPALRRHGL